MAGGLGTVNDPFLIATASEYLAIASDTSSAKKNYKQTADLDFTGITNRSAINLYGSYDGNGFKFKNFVPGNSSTFGFVLYGTIKNLEIDESCALTYNGSSIIGIFSNSAQTGSKFINCINRASISQVGTTSTAKSSGICSGTSSSSAVEVMGCVNYGNLSGHTTSGICVTGDANIIGCANHGKIIGIGFATGIYNGYSNTKPTKNCINTGEIISTQGASAGIRYLDIGYDGSVENCINTGDITGYTQAGGISAGFTSITLKNCFALNNVIYRQAGSTSTTFNRLSANASGATPVNCYALDTMEFRQN
jgi:hypothetical protein